MWEEDEKDDNDAVSYLNSKAPVNINLETGLVFSAGSEADGDVLINIESIQATKYDDILIGNDDKNRFYGSEGDDEIIGGAGDDTLSGGGVRDFSPGTNLSPGEDLLSYKTSPSGVEVSLKNGKAKNDGYGNRDILEKAFEKRPGKEFNEDDTPNSDYSSFENLEGSNFNDILLEGDIGNNKIEGLDGNDNLKGDQGNDTLIGGAGADNLDGGSGFDWADYSDSPEGVSVNLNENFGEGGHAEGDTFERKKKEDLEISISSLSFPFLNLPSSGSDTTDSAVENLLGSDFADSLVGDNGNNKINPGLGNGIDFVNGLEGSDRLIIDYSRDDVGTGIRGGYNLGSAIGGFLSRNTKDGNSLKDAVSFENIEEIQVIGTFKDDEIYGGVGNDEINSGGGNDTIYGGKGRNIIRAGDGDDVVVEQTNINRKFDELTKSSNVNNTNSINSSFILLDGGKGIDTLSADLSSISKSIVLESTNPLLENPNQIFFASYGSAITNFEIFKDIKTGSGNDKLTQIGRINNSFQTGDGDDIINPGLGFDRVDGGGSSISYGVPSSPNQGNLLILDYSVEDTGTGIFYFNDGGERDNVSPEDITEFEYLIENTNENELSEVVRDYVSKRGFYARASADKASILDQVEFNNFERFNITGTSKTDYLVGGGESDILIGKDGRDILIGNYGSDTLEGGNGDDILIGTFIRQALYPRRESDVLTGGEGADQFWLGISKSAYKIGDNCSSTSSNDNYALIKDFNPNEGDTINLYSCDPSNPQEYSLGSSPQNLPLGTAIFSENDLVAIVKGTNSLSLDGNYFNFVQDYNCPSPVKPVCNKSIPI